MCTARCSPNVAEAGFSLVFCMSWFGGKTRLVPRDMPEVEHLRNVSIDFQKRNLFDSLTTGTWKKMNCLGLILCVISHQKKAGGKSKLIRT
jgi:hypothetical protein